MIKRTRISLRLILVVLVLVQLILVMLHSLLTAPDIMGWAILYIIPVCYLQLVCLIPYRNLGHNIYGVYLLSLPYGLYLFCQGNLGYIGLFLLLPFLYFIKTDIREIKWLCNLGDIIGIIIYLALLSFVIVGYIFQ